MSGHFSPQADHITVQSLFNSCSIPRFSSEGPAPGRSLFAMHFVVNPGDDHRGFFCHKAHNNVYRKTDQESGEQLIDSEHTAETGDPDEVARIGEAIKRKGTPQ